MKTLIIFTLFFSTLAFGEYKVTGVKGRVQYDSRILKEGQVLKGKGIIDTGKGSFVKLSIPGGVFVLGPWAELDLSNAILKSTSVKLLTGNLRYVREGTSGKPLTLETEQASMVLDGSDFFIQVYDVLSESQVFAFDGKVDFTNNENKKDKALIETGQWGGLGGRYGKKIKRIKTIPRRFIVHKKRITDPSKF